MWSGSYFKCWCSVRKGRTIHMAKSITRSISVKWMHNPELNYWFFDSGCSLHSVEIELSKDYWASFLDYATSKVQSFGQIGQLLLASGNPREEIYHWIVSNQGISNIIWRVMSALAESWVHCIGSLLGTISAALLISYVRAPNNVDFGYVQDLHIACWGN